MWSYDKISAPAAALALAVTIATGASPASAQQPAAIVYSMPAQELATSIRTVALSSGRNVIVPTALVEGRTAPALHGRFDAATALRQLLEGSGLQVEEIDGSLVIAQSGSAARVEQTTG